MPGTKAKPTLAAGPNLIWGDDKPLNIPEAAAHADMPVSSLNKLIYSRQIESIKKGKRRVVRPSAIRAYFAKHTLAAL